MSNTEKYTECVGELHRKKFGQFFTHPDVAKFMVGWIIDSRTESIFDPAYGLGVFYDQMKETREIQFSANEIDSKIIDFCRSEEDVRVKITNTDYLNNWGRTHQNIICNPPYMKFQNFCNRDAVSNHFLKRCGIKLSGYTNTASAFLLKALHELEEGGKLAFIMPLEFLNSGYGVVVKRELIKQGHLEAIISIECEKEVFPDVITSVGILLYDSSVIHDAVDFRVVTSVSDLDVVLAESPVSSIKNEELKAEDKWLPYFTREKVTVMKKYLTALNSYGHFSRGIATGANEFFTLTKDTIEENQIPLCNVIQCLTKSSQVKKSIFAEKDFKKLSKAGSPVYLLSVNKEDEKTLNYIRKGEESEYHLRYITRHRNPWYKVERREASPLLIGVFSRGGYKVVRNFADVISLTSFHGFQPNMFGRGYCDHLFLFLMSSVGRTIVKQSARKYGDGLDKFEPGDLNSALVPTMEYFKTIPDSLIKQAMKHVEQTDSILTEIESYFAPLLYSAH